MITKREMDVLDRLAARVQQTPFDRIEPIDAGWRLYSEWTIARTQDDVAIALGGHATSHHPPLNPSRKSLATMQGGAIVHALLRDAAGRQLITRARQVMTGHADRLVQDAIGHARDEGIVDGADVSAAAYAYHQLGTFTASISRWAGRNLLMPETMLRAFLVRIAMGCPNARAALSDDFDQRIGEAFGHDMDAFARIVDEMIDADAQSIAFTAFEKPTIVQGAAIARGIGALREEVPRAAWIAACNLDPEQNPDVIGLIRHDHLRLVEMEAVGIVPEGTGAWMAEAGPAAYYAARPRFDIVGVQGVLDIDPRALPIGAFMYGDAGILRTPLLPGLVEEAAMTEDPSIQMVAAAVLKEDGPPAGNTWDLLYQATFGFMSNEPSTEGQDVDYEDQTRVAYIVIGNEQHALEMRAMALAYVDPEDDDHRVAIVYHDGRRRMAIISCGGRGHAVREIVDGFGCRFTDAESVIDGQAALQVLHVE